jgi:hypothetical protein
MVTEGCTGLAQRDDLGVGRRIVVANIAVPSPANDFFVAHHHCTDGNFARFQSALSGAQSFFHPEFVVIGRGVSFSGMR